MAARIVSVAKRVSRCRPSLLQAQHYESQDFLCNRSSPLTRPPISRVESVSDAADTRKLQHCGSQDFLCNRSSSLTRPPNSRAKSVSDATDTRKLQHYGSQDFLFHRSSFSNPLNQPPNSQVKSVPNATDKKELEDFLAKLDLSMEEVKKANARVLELAEEFRVVAAKFIEYAYSEKLRYQALCERLNVTRSCVAVGVIVMLLIGPYV